MYSKQLAFVCLLFLLRGMSVAGNQTVINPNDQKQGATSPGLQARSTEAKAKSRRQILDVDVTDRTDLAILGLGVKDFEVFDNKSLVSLESAYEAGTRILSPEAGVQLLLVLDAINTSPENLGRAEDQARSFLRRDDGRVLKPTSILILTDTPPKLKDKSQERASVIALQGKQAFVRRIPASQDGLALIRALDESVVSLNRISEAQGREGESERVSLSIQALNFIATAERDEPGRKIVIWISPGWPLLARSNSKTREQLFDTIIYFSDLLREARITLNMVDPNGAATRPTVPEPAPTATINGTAVRGGPSAMPIATPGTTAYMEYLKGVVSAKQADGNDLALQVLAHQTGGMVLIENNAIESQIARCAMEAKSFYVLSYDLPPTLGSTAYHKLEIKVKRPDASAHGPSGYYTR